MTSDSLDACLRLLADGRRRQTLEQLRTEPDGTTTVDELVDRIDAGGSAAGPRSTDRAHLTSQLHHTHLPMLADHDVVEYDRATGFVRYRADDRVERVLDSLPGESVTNSH